MKVVSFNVNSVRMRMHQLQALVAQHAPDFIGLQETKVRDEEFPLAELEALGYHVVFHGQKTHYGVALLSRLPFKTSFKGFATDTEESQRRLVGGTFDSPLGGTLTVINGYFPQGENREHVTKFPAKRKFYADLQDYLSENCSAAEQVIVMGDINISPEDTDIGIGEDNRKRWLRTGKASFLPEEREWLQRLHGWGLQDSFRVCHPLVTDQYSWFDYRSKGFDREPKRGLRIDGILVTESLAQRCDAAGIDYEIRGMEKPSDHAPIWSNFS